MDDHVLDFSVKAFIDWFMRHTTLTNLKTDHAFHWPDDVHGWTASTVLRSCLFVQHFRLSITFVIGLERRPGLVYCT